MLLIAHSYRASVNMRLEAGAIRFVPSYTFLGYMLTADSELHWHKTDEVCRSMPCMFVQNAYSDLIPVGFRYFRA